MIFEIQQIFKKDWENYIRFDLKSNNPYVYDCFFHESNEMPIETLIIWMENIKAFPIYFCVQVTESFLDIFHEKVTQHQIRKCFTQQFEGDCNVVILEVQNNKEFSGIFPLLQVISGMDDLVLWSTKKNCFLIGDTMKENGRFSDIPVLVNLEDGITVYSLAQAGTILSIFSEDKNFSTFEKVSSLLPPNIIPIQDTEVADEKFKKVQTLERKVELKHFLFGSYTIGFISGCLGGLSAEVNSIFNLSFSFESLFCILVVLPIFYWTYRYSGMVFNDETFAMKALYTFILFLGLILGVFFTELILN